MEKEEWTFEQVDFDRYFLSFYEYQNQALLYDLFLTYITSASQFYGQINECLETKENLCEEKNFEFLVNFISLYKQNNFVGLLEEIQKAEILMFNVCSNKYIVIPIFIKIFEQVNGLSNSREFLSGLIEGIFVDKHEEFYSDVLRIYS